MITKLLHSYIPEIRQSVQSAASRKRQSRLAPNLSRMKCDEFIKNKLPVSNCAGSFCINEGFKNAILGVDFYSVNIKVRKLFNRVKVNEVPSLTKGLNSVLKEIPEVIHIFKPRKQYKDGLDKHVLSTFQQLMLHPDYQQLKPREKQVLEFSVMLHDVGKAVRLGPAHPELSAKMAYDILKNKPLDDADKTLIVKLIRHHHYSEHIAKRTMTYNDYAKIFNRDEFKLLKILIDSDIKSKRTPIQYRLDENTVFFKEQEKVLRKKDRANRPFKKFMKFCKKSIEAVKDFFAKLFSFDRPPHQELVG